jgi:hypothetical protein
MKARLSKTSNMKKLLLILLLSSCGDNYPYCDSSTVYRGKEISCEGISSDKAVCIDSDSIPTCYPKCLEIGSACEDGEKWHTEVTTDSHVCYCAKYDGSSRFD